MSDEGQVPYVSFRVDPTPAPPGHYRLLGADVSYYTAKIDAWLAYKRIAYRRELATRACFEQDILPRVGYPVIPVLMTPDNTVLQDTTDMMDTLEARHPSPPTVPSAPAGRFFCYLFELFCDEWIKMPALHYRWQYDREFAALEFGRNNDPDLPPEAQRAIGHKIASRFSGWLGPLGSTAATAPAVEADYLALLALLDAHFAAAPTLLGGPPSLADFALYGPFHAHLLRDPHSGSVMRQHAPRVVQYLERLREVPPPATVLPFNLDALPPTLWPIVSLMARDYVPILLSQHAALQRWLGTASPGEVPRDIGRQVVVLGRGTSHEVSGERALFTYDSWMLQRALDVYAGADAHDRAAIERCSALAGTGALLGLGTGHRLRREHWRLVHG
jgi:glutathione S-transferase